MASNVIIPPLGESVTEAVLLRWLKEEGAIVSVDEPILELETDKANVEIPAPSAGRLVFVKKAGDHVRIGDTVAQIEVGSGKGEEPRETKKTVSGGIAAATGMTENRSIETNKSSSEMLSPSVRRLVKEWEVDPTLVQGTGPRGRITKEDVASVVQAKTATGAASMNTAATSISKPKIERREEGIAQEEKSEKGIVRPPDEIGTRRVPMTKIRKKIAERLVTAQHQAAMLTTFNEIDMTEVLLLREKYKTKFTEMHGVPLGLMSFFARAAAVALKEFPAVNACIEGESEIVYHDYVHLGVAVSTERGLVVPVLRNTHTLSFAKIESEIKRMANAAKEGKLSLPELGGGTFTITNGGVFGSLLSTPILNAPQTGILGLHAIQKRPVVVADQIVIRSMMYVALSYDHRLVDGKDSVSFLVRIKNLMEDPSRLMLEV